MAGHSHLRLPAEEPADFGVKSLPVAKAAKAAAAIGLVLAIGMGFLAKDSFREFYFAYLTAFGYFLAISLGALFFVLIHHLTRAGWSVNIRRVAETLAALLPILGVLSLPIFISVIIQKGDLYRWALPENQVAAETNTEPAAVGGAKHGAPSENPETAESTKVTMDVEGEPDPGSGNRKLDVGTLKKRSWLNPAGFCVRLVIYFLIWSLIALYYLKQSTQQDIDGDYRHTANMQRYSGVSLVLLGLSLTLGAFDLFMSLDPHWFSTMFGVYYFAGAVVSFFSATVVIIALMQKAGYLKEAVTVEHYHDLGKYMFAFTFFWGYIAFSQYMLLWYASIPEEVGWPSRHGMTTAHHVPGLGGEWKMWALLALFGCVLIPFPGLMSRHVKRKLGVLVFWAVWILVFQFVNMIWIVMPEMRQGFKGMPIGVSVLAWLGLGGILTAAWIRLTSKYKLRPVNDPRMSESAAFVNV